ncbi:DoxX family membrane protein [Paenibacillus sp. LHD-38]|uniref:DoxX family membrane protein n=1 Tax=Paenibacillus sp. LHD-38 TaxID=3072143 RepID=UPI00280FFD36|nr:DoxX family membrane protein [Paenibacillus sp. LHD-38]MDQ8734875.1 DoxX family membrane protein [Paenibacillus sp. LHD-38]
MDYYAHVKWFTDVVAEKVPIAAVLSPFFMTLAVFVAVLLAVLTQLLPALSKSKLSTRIDSELDKLRKYSLPILKYGTAASLLIQAASGTRFALEFELTSGWQTILMWTAIALLLIPQHYATKIGALAMLVLFIDTSIEAGLFHMLDYGFYLAIIGVLLLERTKESKWGFPLLYLGTGLSLCWVAVEKWIYPAMAEDIITNHNVPTFGFEPALFIVMAGFIEFVVGYLLVVGILNRLLSVVLTLIFISTTMLFGMSELTGHFMIHIVLILFIIEGASFYKPPVSMHRTVIDQMIFVSLNFIFVLATFVLIYYRFA